MQERIAVVFDLDNTGNKALTTLENDLEDALAVMRLPEKYGKLLAKTNMQERLNEEVQRHERVNL